MEQSVGYRGLYSNLVSQRFAGLSVAVVIVVATCSLASLIGRSHSLAKANFHCWTTSGSKLR